MSRANDAVSALLQEYADLNSITGGDAFRTRVYERAARSVAGHPHDVTGMDAAALQGIPNVGRSIAEKIREFLDTGGIAAVDELRAVVPPGVRALTEIPGLGPKRALLLYRELQVTSVDELAAAIGDGRLRDLKGFGARTEENLRHGIDLLRRSAGRLLVRDALDVAEQIVTALSARPEVERCTFAGSLRRMRETIGDVDILVASRRPAAVMAAFVALPLAAEVIASGEAKTAIRTGQGLQVDLRVVPPEAWGAALQYFTGSKEHNVRVRELAVGRGLKLSEYGLFDAGTGELIASATEEEVYARLGLQWVPPTMREDTGEVAAALRGELPVLVQEEDLRGDLHTHTTLTDGVATLEEMLAAAAGRGYEYYAVTDHAPNLSMQRMSDAKMLAQRARLAELDGTVGGLRLLHGTELNIDAGGGVDWPADFLAGFDVCVASVHSFFTQPQAEMTRRLIRACENPHVHVIGHPTGRLLGRRPPVDVDLDAFFEAAGATGTALEINASPERLDLSGEHIALARRHGVKFAIDSDAHATTHLDFVRYGVGTAQRGWLTPDDVVNTWPLDRLLAFLRR
jgi:DNA polymerase (family 10)